MSDASVTTAVPRSDSVRIASRTVGWSSATTPTPRVRPSSACSVAASVSGLNPSIVSTRTSRSGRVAACASICSCSICMNALVPRGSTKSSRSRWFAAAAGAAGPGPSAM